LKRGLLERPTGCPRRARPGTWPPPGGSWSPQVQVASGDRLVLRFSAPQTTVRVTGTTNYPTGLRTPDGDLVSNEALPGLQAVPSDDPARWTLTVPRLDLRAESENLIAVAVAATRSQGGNDFGFSLRTPRFDDYSAPCGTAYFGPGETGYRCYTAGRKGGPPTPAGLPRSCARQARVGVVRRPRLARRRITFKLRVSCPGSLRISVRYRHRTAGVRTHRLAAGGKLTVRVPTFEECPPCAATSEATKGPYDDPLPAGR
jgi:hypothetical protein